MTKKMQSNGFKFTSHANGTIKIDYEKYAATVGGIPSAGEWVWNMAPNHDISHIVCEKLCAWSGINMMGELINDRRLENDED